MNDSIKNVKLAATQLVEDNGVFPMWSRSFIGTCGSETENYKMEHFQFIPF